MRMIKCDPQPEKIPFSQEYSVIWGSIPFLFEWPYVPPWSSKPEKLLLSGPLTSNMELLELRKIDNIWYWVKED